MSKFCILEKDKRPVSMLFRVDEHLRAGGDFKLFNPDTKEVLDHFKLSSEGGKTEPHIFKFELESLNKMCLAWNIVICTKNANNFKGNLDIDIMQMGLKAKTSDPIAWELENIPPCGIGNYEKITGSVFFVIKS
jgi:hypothetical protein